MGQIRFDGQTAIVTGSNSQMGIGFFYAKLLAERGAKVMLHGRREEATREAAEVLKAQGLEVDYAIADLMDEEGLKAIVKKVIDKWGRIDILINNGGGNDSENWPDFTLKSVHWLFDVNVTSAMVMMREVWPYMKAQKYGRIINTSSDSTLGGYSLTAYPITKAAVIGLVQTTAPQGAPDNILINGVYPMAYTQMTSQLPKCQFADVLRTQYGSEKLAPFIAYLCSKENTKYFGQMYSVGGGFISHSETVETVPQAASTIEEVPAALEAAHKEDVMKVPMHSAFEDIALMGMPVEALQSLAQSGEKY